VGGGAWRWRRSTPRRGVPTARTRPRSRAAAATSRWPMRPARRIAVPRARGAQQGEPGRWRAVTRSGFGMGLRPILATTCAAAASLRGIPTRQRTKRRSIRLSMARLVKSGLVGFHGTFMVFITTWIIHWRMCHCQTMERQCIGQPTKSSKLIHEKSPRTMSLFGTVSFRSAHRTKAHSNGTKDTWKASFQN